MSEFAILSVFAEISDRNEVSIITDIRADNAMVYRLHWDPVASSPGLALRAQPHKVAVSGAVEPADMLSLIRDLGNWVDKPDRFILDEVMRYAEAAGHEIEAKSTAADNHQAALYLYARERPSISHAQREAMQYAANFCTPLVGAEAP